MFDTFKFVQTEEERRVLSQYGPWAHASIREQIPRKYPEKNLVQVAQGNYETWRNDLDEKILLRMVTENGLNFRPSRQVGVGREFNRKEMCLKLSELKEVCICDLVDYPTVKVAFITPARLVLCFPDGVATRDEVQRLFGENLDEIL